MTIVATNPSEYAAPSPEALEEYLSNLVQNVGVPGISVTIVSDSNNLTVSAGTTDIGGGAPIGPRSRFAVSCLGRLLTAAAVLLLEQKGSLNLEAPIADYVPGLEKRDSHNCDPIRVAHLLSQTSGYLGPSVDRTIRSWDDAAAFFCETPQLFWPGTVFSEQNLDYVILGQLVRAVTGRSAADLVCETVLTPLGIVAGTSADDRSDPDAYVRGHRIADGRSIERLDFSPIDDLWAPAISNHTMSTDGLARLQRALTCESEGGIFTRETLNRLRNPSVILPNTHSVRRNKDWVVSAFGLGCAHFANGLLGFVSAGLGQCTAAMFHPQVQSSSALGMNIEAPLIRTMVQDYLCRYLSGQTIERAPVRRLPIKNGFNFTEFINGFSPRELSGRYLGGDEHTVIVRAQSDRIILEISDGKKIVLGELQRGKAFFQSDFPASVGFFKCGLEPALRFGMKSYRKLARKHG